MISFSIHKSLHSAQGQLALNISCEVQEGEIATIYGASGAGKTTILRILAGLLNPEKGFITVGGTTWLDTEKKINLLPRDRKVGFVFQDYALFPNMTIRGNLEYALDKGINREIVDELIQIMELEQLQNRYPETLSGGQKQRVALARALVRKPKLLLLDEPLSALDNEMRLKLQDHILQVHRSYALTTILVSHDIAEIYKLSDQIFVVDQGSILKQGTPQSLFSNSQISGKFQMAGEIAAIEQEDIIYIVSVLIHNKIVKVIATSDDIKTLKQGDNVIVSSKAFNPIIRKMDLLK